MKKFLLAALLALLPSAAFAQCTGVFPAGTVCGNNTGAARPPFAISSSTNLTGPGTANVGDLALWGNAAATILTAQTPRAFTKVDDTNVTATLGGTPNTALVNAMSLTLGWTGSLAVTRGGIGITSGTSGGLLYFSAGTSIASSGAISALVLGNGAGAAPTAYPGTSCTNQFPRSLSVMGAATCATVSLTTDVTGTLPIANGGTNATTKSAATTNLLPTATNPGDIIYWNGSAWVNLPGNTSGTQFLQENSSGVPAWATVAGTGTVTSIAQGPGMTFSVTPCTTSCTISNADLPFPQGRLTLTANTPVMTTTTSAQTTLRYDCYVGSRVPYFDGANDQIDTIAACEVTSAMVSAASAGQVVSGNVYDAWWVHNGANRICLAMSAAAGGAGGWASDTGGTNTQRGTGYTQLDRSTRPYTTNKNAITNCFNGATNYGSVAVNQATYLGTIYASANGQISYNFGGSASGGTAALFGVWNMYNRVTTSGSVIDNGASYTYSSASVRQARASAGNQIQFVLGLQEDSIPVAYSNEISVLAAANSAATFGLGFDSTTAYGFQRAAIVATGSVANRQAMATAGVWNSGPGFHTLSANEQGDGTNANSYDISSLAILSATLRN